jgi:hypothetical protein
MKQPYIIDLKYESVKSDLKRVFRHFCLPSEAQEMICAALSPDGPEVLCKVEIDHRGVAGAISYQIYPDRLHIHSLGSLERGAGTRLVTAVVKTARQRHLEVTVSATKASEGFYARRGFERIRGQKAGSIIRMNTK